MAFVSEYGAVQSTQQNNRGFVAFTDLKFHICSIQDFLTIHRQKVFFYYTNKFQEVSKMRVHVLGKQFVSGKSKKTGKDFAANSSATAWKATRLTASGSTRRNIRSTALFSIRTITSIMTSAVISSASRKCNRPAGAQSAPASVQG